MKLAEAYAQANVEEIKTALAGATLRIYSCAQPASPEKSVERNRFLAEFQLASPAFEGDQIKPVEETVKAQDVGVPLFVRATTPEGVTIADFSAGPGDMDVKLADVSCTNGAPVRITKFQIRLKAPHPERHLSPRDRMMGLK
ncbi:conserved hypothetical protein [Beijerinckia indica subsp. indica ATCC 9039]|uniref:Uncharacterized protein n=2 Tax=Beijerinckia TaxID=532 RepID=B2IH57_BEII9|nr:conserved hypothetical protein [Beijerinckia indica subsp. indica ATCC 9039]